MISVIIPAKNAADTIADCLRAILLQRYVATDYEIIVVDDGSTDQTAEIANSMRVRVIHQDNAGPAAARNVGADAAYGDILAFTDADCVPSPEWLHYITLPFQDPQVIGTKGTYRTNQSKFVPRFVQQEYEYKYRRMSRQESIDFIDTYSAAYRRKVFLENGGFESAFAVPSVEDQELSFRLARKGYRLVFAPKAVVYHQHDKGMREYIRRKLGIGYWKAFMLRWLPEKTFKDSHTPPTLRWQILFLALTLSIAALVGVFWPMGWWLIITSLLVFYITALPFLHHIRWEDPDILLITPLMLILRAGALGFGLVKGFLIPPRSHPRKYTGLSFPNRYLKRGLDIFGALLGLIIFTPVLLVAAVAIKLDSSGPVFFSQERAGENGLPFRMFKLRTMIQGAEQRVNEVLGQNSLEGPVYKIPSDPRVTRAGQFLRRWSFDEIPQLWNVLRGEMSLVGPRPEETWVVSHYNDHQRQRLAAKPGLTGPMQVGGRGELDMDERLALELDYINEYSVWLDLKIILRTIPALISGKGAF